MTTEEDFQRALDAHSDDWQTLLVLADWCDDHDCPHGDGYRALAALRRFPRITGGDRSAVFDAASWRDRLDRQGVSTSPEVHANCVLPDDWIAEFERQGGVNFYKPYEYVFVPDRFPHRVFVIFRAAALAFAKLPAERRAELLAPVKAVPA